MSLPNKFKEELNEMKEMQNKLNIKIELSVKETAELWNESVKRKCVKYVKTKKCNIKWLYIYYSIYWNMIIWGCNNNFIKIPHDLNFNSCTVKLIYKKTIK